MWSPSAQPFLPSDFCGVVTIVVLESLWFLAWGIVSLLSSLVWWEPLEKAAVISPVPELPKVHGLGFRVWEGWSRL